MSERKDRIGAAFRRSAEEDRAALVIYTTAGFPTRDGSLGLLLRLADAGTDVFELGIPFSDPLADGPVIQRSSYEAIQNGVGVEWCLDLLRQFRQERDTPVVLFSYLNPILDYGMDAFLTDAVGAGADGVLLTDLPLGADPEIEAKFEGSPLDLVRLIAPTTTPERARLIAGRSQGFVYYISRTGVTGAGQELSTTLHVELEALRSVAKVPIAVGFGISRPDQAAQVATLADGVIVGSAVVDALGRGGVAAGEELVRALRGATGRGLFSAPAAQRP